MKSYIFRIVLCVAFLPAPFVDAQERNPNIIIITASNLGYSDLATYGGEIRTPVLDKLAKEGLQFTQFYSCGNSVMSQTAIMMGQTPHRVGMGYPLVDLKWKNYRGSINDSTATLGEFLQSEGYTTLAVGKWSFTPHWKSNAPRFAWPLNRGFDRFYGTILAQTSYFEPQELLMNTSIYPTDSEYYHTYAIGQEAAEFLERAPKNKPFFLYAAYTAPSWPLQAPQEEIRRYAGAYRQGWDSVRTRRFERQKQLGVVLSRTTLSERDERVLDWSRMGSYALWHAARMEVYAAQVAALDRSIGSILEKLRQIGRDDNTIIIFLSDAGACADELSPKSGSKTDFIPKRLKSGAAIQVGNSPNARPGAPDIFQSYGVPWANVSNTPFRGYADTLYEGGIASPCIIHWGERIEPGKTSIPAHILDIFPTVVEVSGNAFPKELNGKNTIRPTGQSLTYLFSAKERMDAVTSEHQKPRYFFWELQGNVAIRWGKWKLIRVRGSEKWQLYNLLLDRTEERDVYAANAQNPEIIEMITQFEKWRRANHVYSWHEVRTQYRKVQAKKDL
ncbi:MAG: sulfatase-like hydrolase/transferase [Planctomycetia bacterium]|nr:sulfatase-like hydrolase/transferase [Planctomycetia bacterium]